MKKYCGFSAGIGQSECAVLIFANNAREAKKLCYSSMANDFFESYTDVRVKLIKDADYLDSCKKCENPHVIDDPPYCKKCETWGYKLNENGICERCLDV